MPRSRPFAVVALSMALVVLGAACGSSGSDSSAGGAGGAGSVTVASFDFPESEILAHIYGRALEEAGVDVTYKLGLGSREVVAPALEKGEIDLVPEYAGNILAFLDANAAKPGDDIDAIIAKLESKAGSKGLTVLEPSEATDGDVVAMTKARADELGVSSLADLKGKAGDLVFGGPPECPERVTCLKGIEEAYGLDFAEFKALDTGGPITIAALEKGDVDLARVFSSDPAIKAKDLVVLDDPESVQPPGNVVPVIRTDALTDTIRRVLDDVSAKLSTDDLIELNTKVGVDKQDAQTAAEAWLEENGFLKG